MRKPTARGAAFGYACALVTVLWLFLPYGGYERLLEGKYACFALLTAGYLLPVVVNGFFPGRAEEGHGGDSAPAESAEPSALMLVPMTALVAAALVFGVAGQQIVHAFGF